MKTGSIFVSIIVFALPIHASFRATSNQPGAKKPNKLQHPIKHADSAPKSFKKTDLHWTTLQVSTAQDAVKTLRRLHAAVTIGLSMSDYHERLINTSADVMEDLRGVPRGEAYDAISGELQTYIDSQTIWQKITDAVASLPTSSAPYRPEDTGRTIELNAFNTDPVVHIIQSKYTLKEVMVDPEILTNNINQYKADIDQIDKSVPENAASIDKLPYTMQKLHRLDRLRDQTIELERSALNDYIPLSLHQMWQAADDQEQKTESLIPAL